MLPIKDFCSTFVTNEKEKNILKMLKKLQLTYKTLKLQVIKYSKKT